MKVLVALKRVADPNVRVWPDETGRAVDLRHVKMAINPFDEIALEEAVRLKEAGTVAEIIAVSLGGLGCQEALRTALAMGADRAIHVHTDALLQPLLVAKLLLAVAVREAPQLVLLGKQAIDDEYGQTGQMLAALAHWPQAAFASQLTIDGPLATVVREIDGGQETVQLQLPAVVTVDLLLNEPRYVKLPNLIAAKRKLLELLDPQALGVDPTPSLEELSVVEPSVRRLGERVARVSELVERLVNVLQRD